MPTLGGQTGLNLAMELAEEGFLEEQGVKLLGANPETIKRPKTARHLKIRCWPSVSPASHPK